MNSTLPKRLQNPSLRSTLKRESRGCSTSTRQPKIQKPFNRSFLLIWHHRYRRSTPCQKYRTMITEKLCFWEVQKFRSLNFWKNQARCQSVNLQKQIYNLCLGYRHSNDKYCTKQCKTCKYRRYHNFSAKKLFNKQLSCRRKHSNHHQSSLWEKNQKSEFREHIYEIKRYFWVKYLLRMDQHLFY